MYATLNKLHSTFAGTNFQILAFPCNQYGGQEPGTDEQIQKTCAEKFKVEFPVFAKTKVTGADAHPVFAWLSEELENMVTGTMKWNFTTYLVDVNGRPAERFNAGPSYADLESAVRRLQAASPSAQTAASSPVSLDGAPTAVAA